MFQLSHLKGSTKMQENIIGPMGATLSDSLECPADGAIHQGFTMGFGRFECSRVVGCISVKTNDLLVAGFEGFLKESHEMFFKYVLGRKEI